MNCGKCSADAATNLKRLGPLCTSCYSELVENRVKKDLRKQVKITKDMRFVLKDNGTAYSKAGIAVLKHIFNDKPVVIDSSGDGILVSAEPIDEQIIEKLENIFLGDKNELQKQVMLFRSLSKEELIEYISCNKIEGAIPESNAFAKELDDFEKKYPGTKASCAKALGELLD